MKSIASNCPRFSACSVNNCPLEPEYPNLITHESDKEKKRPMEKGVRVRISNQFQGILKYGGLTKPEWVGKQRYDALPLAVKVEMENRGRQTLKNLNRH